MRPALLLDAPPDAIWRLPIEIDAARLAAEFEALSRRTFAAHPSGFAGNSALRLVTVRGGENDDFPLTGPLALTPVGAQWRYFREILAALGVPVSRARVMRLAAGARVPEHMDANHHWHRHRRIHIPLVTNAGAVLRCRGAERHMPLGQAWTFDHLAPHSVENAGSADRLHIVIDVHASNDTRWGLPAHLAPDAPVIRIGDDDAPLLGPAQMLVANLAEFAAIAERLLATAGATLRARWDDWAAAYRACWAAHGEDSAGELRYASLQWRFRREIEPELLRHLEPNSREACLASVFGKLLQPTNHVPAEPPAPATESLPPDPDTWVAAAPWWRNRRQLPGSGGALLDTLGTPRSLAEIPASDRDTLAQLRAIGAVVASRRSPPRLRPVFVVGAPEAGAARICNALLRCGGFDRLQTRFGPLLEAALDRPGAPSDRLEPGGDAERDAVAARLAGFCAPHLASAEDVVAVAIHDSANAMRLALLDWLFPECRFVFVERTPQTNIPAIVEGWRRGAAVTHAAIGDPPVDWSYALPPGWEAWTESPLEAVAQFQRAAVNAEIGAFASGLATGRGISLRFEDLPETDEAVAALIPREWRDRG